MMEPHEVTVEGPSRKTFIRCGVIALVVILLLIAAGYAFVIIVMGVNDSGSPRLAEEWARDLDRFASPNAALKSNPQVGSKTYPDGEWVFGLSQNSHGPWWLGGGTVVVKDSRGGLHAFFDGHVCGPGFLGHDILGDTKTLDEFYEKVRAWDFVEHKFGWSRPSAKPSGASAPMGPLP
jgi:hypothetical protein